MAIVWLTGRKAKLNCRLCEELVTHYEYEYPDLCLWQAAEHLAPCGAPCFYGGASPSTTRFGVHGGWEACPKCGATDTEGFGDALEGLA